MSRAARFDSANFEQASQFIRANTKRLTPPLVPEISLHLAEESLAIWQKTEEDLAQDNIAPPYWAFAWAGGQALARYTLDNRNLFQGKRVIDLGTGSGLTAIAAALAGASSVLATDIDPLSVAAARLNAGMAQVEIIVTDRNLLTEAPLPHDILLIGDLFYERDLADAVSRFAAGSAAQDALVLCGDPKRNYFPEADFKKVAAYQVPVTRELEDMTIKNTSVWQRVAIET